MNESTVLLFTRNGLGEGPADLQALLAVKYLNLLVQSTEYPGKVLFYTEGVKLCCEGSLVLESLKQLEKKGVELILCSTCLNQFGLTEKVRAGVAAGMPEIFAAIQAAQSVISL